MEDFKLKKISLFILSILMILLTSCWREDTTQLAKDEFSKYHNGKDEVVLNIEDNLYFENHILKRENLDPKNLYDSLIFYDNLIYYLALDSSNWGLRLDYINVYSCDYYGMNPKKICSKELNINKKVKVKTEDDCFYIQYDKDNLTYIDKYTISTNVYENIDKGKDCSLKDYVTEEESSKYNIEMIENVSPQKHGKFVITDSETGIKKTIDDEYLENTIYIESMEIFNYGPDRYDISNGHILLTYGIGAGDGWNYPYLVFDYDFDSDTLEYKLLAFPFDSVPIKIIYIG